MVVRCRHSLLSFTCTSTSSPIRSVTSIASSRYLSSQSHTTYHPSDFTGSGSGIPPVGETYDSLKPSSPKQSTLSKALTPRKLKQFLDTYVVGQARPKRVLSVAVYNHYQRVQALRRKQEEEDELDDLGMGQYPAIHPVEDEFPGHHNSINHAYARSTRTKSPNAASSVDLQKSNVLMIGPSGVGKTLIARTLARILDVPFSISDCTAFTQAGYVGDDADICVQRLLSSCNWDVKRAEMGIICLDEVDKIATAKMVSNARDVSGEGVQQALLKILEGTTLQISNKSERRSAQPGFPVGGGSTYPSGHPPPYHGFTSGNSGTGSSGTGSGSSGKGEVYNIDTSNILFILCGAFNGLDKTIMDRVSKHSIGFNAPVRKKGTSMTNMSPETEAQLLRDHRPYFSATDSMEVNSLDLHSNAIPHNQRKSRFNPLELVEPRDLTSFGLIPEFVGRVPVVAALESLDEEMLVRVLSEPRNCLVKQYEHLFQMSEVELKFTSKALREVARTALSMETGARGLRTVLERLLTDAMFETPGSSIKHVLVNQSVASRKQPPVYFARGHQTRFLDLIASEEAEWAAENTRSGDVGGEDVLSATAEKERAAGFV